MIVDCQHWAQRQHRETSSQRDIQSTSNIRESVLIDEDVVVGRATGSENSPVTQQIKVKFDRVNHIAVNNSASDAIPASVALVLNAREKPNVVPLADYDQSDGGLETQLNTRLYVDVRSRRHETYWVTTSNERKFLLEDRGELSFRDAI